MSYEVKMAFLFGNVCGLAIASLIILLCLVIAFCGILDNLKNDRLKKDQ